MDNILVDAFSRKGTQSHDPTKVSKSSIDWHLQFGVLCSRGSALLMWNSLPAPQFTNFLGSGHPRNMSGCIHGGLVLAFSVLVPTNCNDSDDSGESVLGIYEIQVLLVAPLCSHQLWFPRLLDLPSTGTGLYILQRRESSITGPPSDPIVLECTIRSLGLSETVAELAIQAVLDSNKLICIYQM